MGGNPAADERGVLRKRVARLVQDNARLTRLAETLQRQTAVLMRQNMELRQSLVDEMTYSAQLTDCIEELALAPGVDYGTAG